MLSWAPFWTIFKGNSAIFCSLHQVTLVTDLLAPIGELVADLLAFGDRVLELDLPPQPTDLDLVDVLVVDVKAHLKNVCASHRSLFSNLLILLPH